MLPHFDPNDTPNNIQVKPIPQSFSMGKHHPISDSQPRSLRKWGRQRRPDTTPSRNSHAVHKNSLNATTRNGQPVPQHYDTSSSQEDTVNQRRLANLKIGGGDRANPQVHSYPSNSLASPKVPPAVSEPERLRLLRCQGGGMRGTQSMRIPAPELCPFDSTLDKGKFRDESEPNLFHTHPTAEGNRPPINSSSYFNGDCNPPISSTRILNQQENQSDPHHIDLGFGDTPTPQQCYTGIPSWDLDLGQLRGYGKGAYTEDEQSPPPVNRLFHQLPTRPISQEELITEIRGIYAGLVMVENKCIEMNQAQFKSETALSHRQWHALIGLHRTLLNEHHDFFMASHHPGSGEPLKQLASKYCMPARLWQHGIHSFLELLRERLPQSLDHMLVFIYAAYNTITLLMEAVPCFRLIWIECLGDLSRYRMAVEQRNIVEREVWAGVARQWYLLALEENPHLGRLQHHLAVLTRPNIIEQLFYYTKSLLTAEPFVNTRGSIHYLFDPLFGPNPGYNGPYGPALPIAISFVKAHAILFNQGKISQFIEFVAEHASLLTKHVRRMGTKFRDQGVHIASSNIAAMLEYGNDNVILVKAFKKSATLSWAARIQAAKEFWAKASTEVEEMLPPIDVPFDDTKFLTSLEVISYASFMTFHIFSLLLTHINEKAVIPHVHIILIFIWSLALVPESMAYFQREIPWEKLVFFLNTLSRRGVDEFIAARDDFPTPANGTSVILPEDILMRGQIWARPCYPDDFFSNPAIDYDERGLELPSIAGPRTERCLWYAYRLASLERWIIFDENEKKFRVTPLARELEKSAQYPKIFGLSQMEALADMRVTRSRKRKESGADTTVSDA
ncbi:uncharacterized protein PADG_02188 [Paracoccidioides brasiliensis Pb18]|uniref:DNA/RNA-binding domain-containing protein n=1 Tax=Paracoccidioides brasiliensis (strain Pb18) TaxID=502780 RepID=C1G222_PARBD|nr:uncharacterized protein PADG_02188 [Paracoccidioides brasiliensis Pb18]EEH46038.2 hypothetical protein PADG_02188 [Paracoccidioides brasiliensis Pb18]